MNIFTYLWMALLAGIITGFIRAKIKNRKIKRDIFSKYRNSSFFPKSEDIK